MQDENLSHPDLELMITTNEEVGLIGANAVSEDFLKGEYLINVDSEEEGIMTCGCAGGNTLILSLQSNAKILEIFLQDSNQWFQRWS
ncbi:MAG: hypothetical protein ACLS8T_23895 [Anaerobutyricum sp.]